MRRRYLRQRVGTSILGLSDQHSQLQTPWGRSPVGYLMAAYAVHEHTTRNHRWGLLIVAKCCHHTRNNMMYSAFKEERLPGTWYKQSRQRDSHQLAGSFCWPTGPHSPMFSSMQRSEQHSLPPQADLDEPCAANGGTGVFVAYTASSFHCSAPSRLAITLTLRVTSAPHAKGVTSQLSEHR